jgi:hypothetical protein
VTARDSMEAATHAALSRYKQAVAEGTWRVTADNQLVDTILKAADKYALTALDTRVRDQIEAGLAAGRRAALEEARSQAWVAAGKRTAAAR